MDGIFLQNVKYETTKKIKNNIVAQLEGIKIYDAKKNIKFNNF